VCVAVLQFVLQRLDKDDAGGRNGAVALDEAEVKP